MTLRLRLAVAAIAVAAATIVPLLWIETSRFHEEAAQRLLVSVEHVIARPGSQARCETSAATWHPLHARVGPGARPDPAPPGPKMRERLSPPGPDLRELPPPPVLDREVELFVYDRDLRPAHPDAPQLGEQIARNLAEAGAFVLPRRWLSDNVEVVATTPWRAGACAYVYARDDLPDRKSVV